MKIDTISEGPLKGEIGLIEDSGAVIASRETEGELIDYLTDMVKVQRDEIRARRASVRQATRWIQEVASIVNKHGGEV